MTPTSRRTTNLSDHHVESRRDVKYVASGVSMAPNGEVEGPHAGARLEPRVHTVFSHPRRHYRRSRPPPTIVRRPAFHELNFRCPRDLVLSVDSASWRKLARIIQASYCDVYAAWLFIANPCKCRAASSAKCSGNAGGRVKCPWATASYRELFGAHEEPPHRLSSCRAPAIGAMAHQ